MKRKAQVKTDELEIRVRSWPLLVAVGYDKVCHISYNNGILRAGHKRHKNTHDKLFAVTKCNRALAYTVTRNHVPLDDMDLCSRCGTRADFEAASVTYQQKREEHRQEMERQDAVRMAERQLEHDRKMAVLEALYQAFEWSYVQGVSWNPVTGETDRGQPVIYLHLSSQLPGVITVDGRDHAYPHLYRAVVTLELVPENDRLEDEITVDLAEQEERLLDHMQ